MNCKSMLATFMYCIVGALSSLGATADRAMILDEMSIAAGRQWPIWSAYRDIPSMKIILQGKGQDQGGIAGSCPSATVAHTDANFGGGSFIVQAGMGETEVAAASYVLPASAFPLRLDMTEMIFATSNAAVQTTTKWSVMVWEGTPAAGSLKYTFSSDGKMIPHIVLAPGTNGVNVQFMIDPNDPDQMYLSDDGSHTFSIGYRIDHHNNQTQNPCAVAPPSSSNAFPTTDTSGLQQPSKNWLYLLDCGSFGCGVGWKTFAQLPSLFFVVPVATGSCVRHIPQSTAQHSRARVVSERIVQSRLKQIVNPQAEHIAVTDRFAQAQYACLKATTLVVLHRLVDASVCHTSHVSPLAAFPGKKEVCAQPMFVFQLEHAV